MKFKQTLLFFLIYLCTNTCFAKDKFPPEGKSVAEMAELQNGINKQLKALDSEKWEERNKAKQALLSLIENNKFAFDYFLNITKKHKSPEVKISAKEILEKFFFKNVHDPDRKKGFIGLSLSQGGEIVLDKKRYSPIIVVSPIPGLPGEKAGVKSDDIIIEVDKNICSKDFDMESFITYIASKKPGDKVSLKIFSKGKVVVKTVVLGERTKEFDDDLDPKSKKELFEEWYSLLIIKKKK